MSDHKAQALEELKAKLPPTFCRQDIAILLPGIISPLYLSRLDCQGKGPERFKITNKVYYRRDSFIDWLAKR